VPVAHQVFVWFCWRTELHASLLTRALGRAAFTLYAVVFSLLGIARIVSVFLLAIANHGTAPGNPIMLKLLALILLIPALYLLHSVRRYFGFRRAFGIDHFDESYRSLPLVREGIFRYASNGMYAFGFLLIWFPGLWYASLAALAAALFNHLYIWVHYYCTERPDMVRIYGDAGPT
jgi:protein-S-isoprenylcysteine O-methyltransferase Ste14